MKTFDEALKEVLKEDRLLAANLYSYKTEQVRNDEFIHLIKEITFQLAGILVNCKTEDMLPYISSTCHVMFSTGMLVGQRMEKGEK